MTEDTKTPEPPKPTKEKLFQFSIWDLLVLTTIVAVCLSVYLLLEQRYAAQAIHGYFYYRKIDALFFPCCLFWLSIDYGLLIKKQDHQGKKWMLRGGLTLFGVLTLPWLLKVRSIDSLEKLKAIMAVGFPGLFIGACLAFNFLCIQRRQFCRGALELIVLVIQLAALVLFLS